jgi:hypothetical protein
MPFFNRTPAKQAQLEARVLEQDFDAAIDYLRGFVAGDTIDRDYVLRALALLAVESYVESEV